MPTSNIGSIPLIMDAILRKHRYHQELKSILDIGIGYGKYGLLCREYITPFDIMDDTWKRLRLDGVEVFPTYIKPYSLGIYSNIFVMDIRKFCEDPRRWCKESSWDMILLLDIIEHMNKEEGIQVIRKLSEFSRWILICTPELLKFYPQAVKQYHPKERHVSLWEIEDFEQFNVDEIILKQQFLIVMLEGDLLINDGDTLHLFNDS